MRAFSGIPEFWLNFGLHMAVISGFAWIVLVMTKDPGRRAYVSATGVLSILILPWISATRLGVSAPARSETVVAPVEAPKWEGWTIRIEDKAPVVRVADIAPTVGQAVEPADPVDWEKAILMAWAMGSATGFGLVMRRQLKLAKWRKSLRPISDDERLVLGSLVKLDFRNVRSADEPVNPCVVGFFRPCMVIPAYLFEGGRSDRLKWAAKHEAEHLRAGDSRWAVVLSFAKAILWWNPVVHHLCASWAEDREKVCDARAIGDVAERKSYGGFLLELAEANQVRGAIAMASNAPASRLRRRLESIVQGIVVKKESVGFKTGSLVCFAVVGLLVSFVGVKKLEARETTLVEQAAPEPSVRVEPAPAPPDENPPFKIEKGTKLGPFPVKMEVSLVVTSSRIAEAGSILNEEQRQLLMRRIASVEGSFLITTPSVSAKSGQAATVEIIRTNPNERVGIKDAPGESFVGVSSHMISVLEEAENGIKTTVDCRLGYAPGTLGRADENGNWPIVPSRDFNWSSVRKAAARASKIIRSGETMVVAFEGVEEGLHLTGLFKATLIDVTGTSVYQTANPVWTDGVVKVRGAVLTLPEDRKLPSYWFTFPSNDRFESLWPTGHWEAISREAEDVGQDTWKGLGGAVISSGTSKILGPPYPVNIGVRTAETAYVEVRMTLPDEDGNEIKALGPLGSIMGIELKPDASGRKRWLMLALDPVP